MLELARLGTRRIRSGMIGFRRRDSRTKNPGAGPPPAAEDRRVGRHPAVLGRRDDGEI